MKKLYFICNLLSGKAAAASCMASVVNSFTKAGYEVTVHPTQSRGDAAKKALYACMSGCYDLIVCCGGDGTLNEVISGCMKAEKCLPVGYIPTGSTNDFARSLGIPKNPADAVRAVINGRVQRCDIGMMNKNRYFTYIAAFGAFTEVSYSTSQPVKNILGHTAYLLNGMMSLPKIRCSRMRIEHGGKIIEDDFIYGMVTNSSSVAKLLSMPDMKKDDGLFEVTLIRKPKSIAELKNIITGLLNFRLGAEKKYFYHFRASEITVTCLEKEPVPWTVDGEFGGKNTVNVIKNIQKALPVILHGEKKEK